MRSFIKLTRDLKNIKTGSRLHLSTWCCVSYETRHVCYYETSEWICAFPQTHLSYVFAFNLQFFITMNHDNEKTWPPKSKCFVDSGKERTFGAVWPLICSVQKAASSFRLWLGRRNRKGIIPTVQVRRSMKNVIFLLYCVNIWWLVLNVLPAEQTTPPVRLHS